MIRCPTWSGHGVGTECLTQLFEEAKIFKEVKIMKKVKMSDGS